MGYSHYVYRAPTLDPKKFATASKDCRKVCEALMKKGLKLQYESDTPNKKPVFTKELVRFNGVDNEGHETFLVDRVCPPSDYQSVDKQGRVFQFCKTAHKPYDLAVCACCIIFAHHLKKDFVVRSDGDAADDGWVEARQTCQAVLGYGEHFAPDSEEGESE